MGGYTYETVYKAEAGSYEWAVIAVFRRSDDTYAVVSESGCSCDYFEDEMAAQEAQYAPSKAKVYADFRKALITHQYTFNVAQAFEHEDAMRRALYAVWKAHRPTLRQIAG
jgi:hypothetical protein